MIYGKLAVKMLNTIASEKKDSTNAVIASWLLDHQKDAGKISIKAVAEGAHVGIASVSRFVRELGFEDFAELKELLMQGLDEVSVINAETERLPSAILHEIEEGLERASSVDMQAIEIAARAIDHYHKIHIFSLLKGEAAAISLAADLRMLGKDATTLFAYPEQIDTILNSTQDELIILFSYSGSYFEYEERLPEAGKIKAPIIMVSGGENRHPSLVSQFIRFDSNLDQSSHPYTMIYIADLIAQTYAGMLKQN